MVFTEDYYRDETKNGFHVSSLMKRCWAAQLEVLEQFDAFCKANKLQYWLAYGSLLGAVRHEGFIPWDDDIDVWMFREDADRLMKLSSSISEMGLELVTPYSDHNYNNLAFRLINTRVINLDESFLNKYSRFPFMAGIDIFPLDHIPDNESEKELLITMAVSANVLGQCWNNPEVTEEEKQETFKMLAEMVHYHKKYDGIDSNELWQLTDRICAAYAGESTQYIACLPYYVSEKRKVFRTEWFEKTKELKFENAYFPCPESYNEVLEAEFGPDYMIPIQTGGDHEYPYYRNYYRDLMQLYRQRDINCPRIYENI